MSEPFARPGTPLCTVVITYVADLDHIDAMMADHVAWLTTGYEQGVILVSGRRNPRNGGVVLFRGTREEVHAVAVTDPFVTHGLAEIEVIEFSASMAAPALADLLG